MSYPLDDSPSIETDSTYNIHCMSTFAWASHYLESGKIDEMFLEAQENAPITLGAFPSYRSTSQ